MRTIYLILLAALALRLWHITDPPWDYHNWRQTITLMVARDFARHGLPVLHPQVQWVGDRPLASSLTTIRSLRGELWRARRDTYAAAAVGLRARVSRPE